MIKRMWRAMQTVRRSSVCVEAGACNSELSSMGFMKISSNVGEVGYDYAMPRNLGSSILTAMY